ncbi:MAG: PEP-CTERM sorting domain-containing protein [Bryobacteraceae bacterium]|nr:PEP-CTERM sorting domain-containing protein [Bryobacteraceae bacterium]
MTYAARSLVLGALFSVASLAAPIIPFLIRPLPTENLNEAAGPDRSNNSFSESDPTARYNGDVFGLPGSALTWQITEIRVWSVASVLGEALGQEFSEVTLYGRVRGETMEVLSTGNPDDSFDSGNLVKNSNPNIEHRQVKYKNGEDYEGVGTPGVFYPIWEHRFTNLFWNVPGGKALDFAPWGVGANPDPTSLYGFWFNHVSNRALSGVPQLLAYNGIWIHDFATPDQPGFRRDVGVAGLWDKGADMNVVVYARLLPEPQTYAMMAAGLAALVAIHRRRRSL